MARYTGPTQRINRRFKKAIFKAKKAFERRKFFPGQHGQRLRRKVSVFSTGLNEKQKVRFYYGLTEKQFCRFFDVAKRMPGVLGTNLLILLERRLDNVVYRLGFASSRKAARQFVAYGHVLVGGKKVDIPSSLVESGDVISVKERMSSRQLATRSLDTAAQAPVWFTVDADTLSGSYSRDPMREELDELLSDLFDAQKVVEFYSR